MHTVGSNIGTELGVQMDMQTAAAEVEEPQRNVGDKHVGQSESAVVANFVMAQVCTIQHREAVSFMQSWKDMLHLRSCVIKRV